MIRILRGDIFFVKKGGYVTGHEQEAGRPAIIISNDIGNEHSGNVEVVFLTTQEKKPLPTHVNVLCQVPSIALCEAITTVSKESMCVEHVKSNEVVTEEQVDTLTKILELQIERNTYKSMYEHLLAKITER